MRRASGGGVIVRCVVGCWCCVGCAPLRDARAVAPWQRRLGWGGGKGKSAFGGSKPGDEIDPERGGKKGGIQNVGNGLPPIDRIPFALCQLAELGIEQKIFVFGG